MTNVAAIADILGMRPHGAAMAPVEFMDAVERGLPLSALTNVLRHIADDTALKYRVVSKATLARRQKARHLSAEESEKVARIARIWVAARELWGSDEEARDFLLRKHPMLEDRRPIDVVIGSEIGAKLVEDILGRLRFGSAA